jgi:hypothetical protein
MRNRTWPFSSLSKVPSGRSIPSGPEQSLRGSRICFPLRRYGTASGTLSYDKDFSSFIKSGQVRIHRADVLQLSDHQIHLSSGDTLPADVLICATGFSAKPRINFEPPALHSALGVPSTSLDRDQESFWAALDGKADVTIGRQFPRLLVGPHRNPASSEPRPFNPGMAAEARYTPWRLYRGISPPGLTKNGDHSLVFLGMFSNLANTLRLEVQCLWALAYLNGKLRSVYDDMNNNKVYEEAALLQRWAQHRAPFGHGRFYPDLVFDQLPYWDQLLNDLGLETKRKGGLRELFEPYTQKDYRGLLEEWMAKNRPFGR